MTGLDALADRWWASIARELPAAVGTLGFMSLVVAACSSSAAAMVAW